MNLADRILITMQQHLTNLESRMNALETQPRGQLWGVCSAFLALPGLRGFWPMSAFDSSGNAIDVSGHGHTLSYNGNPTYNCTNVAPYIALDGTGDYLSRADEADLDILGTESYVGIPGLTLGGWFYSTVDSDNQALIGKYGAAGSYSYLLQAAGAVGGDPLRFWISDDGTNTDDVVTSGGYTTSAWFFAAARFDDSDTGEEQAIWLNGTKTTDTTARASIFNSGANLAIGGTSAGGGLLTGRASLCFLCAAAVPDNTISLLYQCSRALFGV